LVEYFTFEILSDNPPTFSLFFHSDLTIAALSIGDRFPNLTIAARSKGALFPNRTIADLSNGALFPNRTIAERSRGALFGMLKMEE
jgi:hypothetical protein